MEPASPRPSFLACLHAAWTEPELMRQYRRLTGSTIGLDTRSSLDRMIDDATGNVPTDGFGAFLRFVADCIWSRLPGTPTDDDVILVALLTAPRREEK